MGGGQCAHPAIHFLGSEGSLQGLVLSFHSVGSGDGTQVNGLGSKLPGPLSRLASPGIFFHSTFQREARRQMHRLVSGDGCRGCR